MPARLAVPTIIALVVSIAAGTAYAAFQERDIINTINNTVAVLRFLHRQTKDVREKRDMVKNTRLLTEKQYAAQKEIVREEQSMKKSSPIKLEIYNISLSKLERQTKILRGMNLEKTYATRLDVLGKTIARYRIQLDAKILEFRVHFGKAPNVNLDFQAKISRFRQKELGVTYITIR